MWEDWRDLNRANWDERVAVHLGPGGYDLRPLRAERGRLGTVVDAELGSVAGLRSSTCNAIFEKDNLILASRGADVTGLDFSATAVAKARTLLTITLGGDLAAMLSMAVNSKDTGQPFRAAGVVWRAIGAIIDGLRGQDLNL